MIEFDYDHFSRKEKRRMVAQPKAPMEGILPESTLRAKLDEVMSYGKGLADEGREEFKERARLAIHQYKESMSNLDKMRNELSSEEVKSQQDSDEKVLDKKLEEIKKSLQPELKL